MWASVENGGEVKWEVVEERGDRGGGGRVTARAENNWPADENR